MTPRDVAERLISLLRAVESGEYPAGTDGEGREFTDRIMRELGLCRFYCVSPCGATDESRRYVVGAVDPVAAAWEVREWLTAQLFEGDTYVPRKFWVYPMHDARTWGVCEATGQPRFLAQEFTMLWDTDAGHIVELDV